MKIVKNILKHVFAVVDQQLRKEWDNKWYYNIWYYTKTDYYSLQFALLFCTIHWWMDNKNIVA